MDRRVIKRRIALLRRKLEEIEKERRVQRAGRERLPAVALVGYTNAGKSALFQRLTQRATLVEDRLFATLDPLVRRAIIGPGVEVTVADTVGFIRKLPHELVASFRATLAEAATADVLVHVVDASHPRWPQHLAVGEEVLEGLGVEPARCVVALNKVDQVAELPEPPAGRRSVVVAALTGQGLGELEALVASTLEERGLVQVLRFSAEGGEALRAALARGDLVGRRFSSEGVELYFRRR
jgi:GTP-binding protein HflX